MLKPISCQTELYDSLVVRKVKMALDPPTGCSFSTLKPPKVKLEAIRSQLSNVKSTLSSEWGAIRKVRVAPRIPPNGSLSRQSLAYLHAGTRYVKDVSEILKLGVTTLRSSSTSYEVVPGMQLLAEFLEL